VKHLVALALFVFWAGQALAHDVPGAGGIDLTHLPLGDNRLSQEPKAGWIWACRIENASGGALVVGPWIKADGTYDLTMKAVVSGSVNWTHRFVMSASGSDRVFTTNDLPDHPSGIFPISPADPAYRYDRNPNGIATQDMRVVLPLTPAMARQPSCTPGAVGILLTGVVLFSALDAQGRDAVAHELQDSCQGHPQRSGTYHYHNITACLDDKAAPDQHSALVGYALDGFGIYGNRGEGGKNLTSADLDACHGHTHKIVWEGKTVEMYHYHGTWDFPYTVGCMRGVVNFETVRAVSGGGAPGGPGLRGRVGPPNFDGAAKQLGISPERLREALGPPPPDFGVAAKRLGISEDALMRALNPRPQ
jgi:hypothetical protein